MGNTGNTYTDPAAGWEASAKNTADTVTKCAQKNPNWAYLTGLFLPFTFTEYPGYVFPAVPGVTNTQPPGMPVSPYSGTTGPVKISANALTSSDTVFIDFVNGLVKDYQASDDKLYQEKKYESEHLGLSPGEVEALLAVGIAGVAGIGIAFATRK